MEIIKKIMLDMLTTDSVSVVVKQFTRINGNEIQMGNPIRKTYCNSANNRQLLIDEVGEPYTTSVFAVWGDTPTAEDVVTSVSDVEYTQDGS